MPQRSHERTKSPGRAQGSEQKINRLVSTTGSVINNRLAIFLKQVISN